MLIKTKLLLKLNGFNESLQTGEDWDFFLRAIGLTEFYNLQEYLSTKRFHPENISLSQQALNETEFILKSYNNAIIEKSNDEKMIGEAFFNIGYFYYYENNFKQANIYFKKSINNSGLNLQHLRYYLFSKYLNWLIRFSRKNKLYKLFNWLKYFDKSNKYVRSKF